jgi:CubicO group peptidase (beta-lactamase class C family)
MKDAGMDLTARVAELLAEHATPGAAMGLVEDGEHTIVTAGTRGADRGRVERDTIFAAASLTKPVFAVGVMTLVDDGALELDRPLSDYVAEPYVADDDRAATITARMVLSHTTGLPNWRQGSDDRAHPPDGALRLRWTPGTRWGYSGEGFTYLQQVVEQLSAAPLADFLTDVVLRPLGMTDSTFAWPEADDPRRAIGHDDEGNARPRFRPPAAKAAAGGLFTTAPDYLRFLDHCLVHEQAMFAPQAPIDDELAWGLGWGLEIGEETAVWQWGNDPGWKNFVIGRPGQRVGVVVFTNGDRGADAYTSLVSELLPGRHPSLDAWHRPGWISGWQAS